MHILKSLLASLILKTIFKMCYQQIKQQTDSQTSSGEHFALEHFQLPFQSQNDENGLASPPIGTKKKKLLQYKLFCPTLTTGEY